MSGNGGSAVALLSYETLVHAVAGAMVSRDVITLCEVCAWSRLLDVGIEEKKVFITKVKTGSV